jgi:hypothetical protein
MSAERVQLQALPKADKYRDIVTGKRLPIYEGIPDVRDLLVPKEGHGLWNLDLSQAELRVASIYARCEEMLRELGEGQDIHSNNTRTVLKVPEDAPDWKLKRDIAKRLTFGGIFQIGPQSSRRPTTWRRRGSRTSRTCVSCGTPRTRSCPGSTRCGTGRRPAGTGWCRGR